jgi:hypothetical protein
MQTVLFCIPLKKGCLVQYEAFAKEHVEKAKEYSDMLKRYDIHTAQTWHKNIDNRDYIFVYHKVGPNFQEKMAGWDTSVHPFDRWFREQMMAVYDIENAAGMEQPRALVDFIV